MTDFLRQLVNLFFPHKCIFCATPVDIDRFYCEKCIETLPTIPDPICLGCGMEKAMCSHFHHSMFDGVIGCFYYVGTVRKAMARFKFKGQKKIADCLTGFMAKTCLHHYGDIPFDVVTAVPMYPAKEKLRGYNQAQLLGEHLAERLHLPFDQTILQKHKDNQQQHLLKGIQRQQNVKGVYMAANTQDIKGKIILLIDDVKTTGATFSECAAVLKAAGAGAVYCMATCIAI